MSRMIYDRECSLPLVAALFKADLYVSHCALNGAARVASEHIIAPYQERVTAMLQEMTCQTGRTR